MRSIIAHARERVKAYKSNAIKQRAVKMYVSWVAMESVCDDYVKKIKISREELYSYLCENPTVEQSHARIKLLCQEFSDRIEAENDKMTQTIKQLEDEKDAQASSEDKVDEASPE